MNEYLITRDDSESLTHFGVKGMKWKHHKAKKDAAFYYGQDKAYEKEEKAHEKSKVLKKLDKHFDPTDKRWNNTNSAYAKTGRAYRKVLNANFDTYAKAQETKYRISKKVSKKINFPKQGYKKKSNRQLTDGKTIDSTQGGTPMRFREGSFKSRPDYKKILKNKAKTALKSSKKAAAKGYKRFKKKMRKYIK